jgi:thiamine biosynthesis lipoprotein
MVDQTVRRARPLLGTVVSIHLHDAALTPAQREAAFSAAFDGVAHIGRVMSAHASDSDLARLSQATAGAVLTLDPHTVHVLQAAQYWQRVSHGAFNPGWAATRLSAAGQRPGLTRLHPASAGLHALEVLSDTTVKLQHAIQLDLGGIAKGYAVDCAITKLQQHGVVHALVNAGGDMRAIGSTVWPVDVRHAQHHVMDVCLRGCPSLQHQALATSVAAPINSEFVHVRRFSKQRWRSATVQAPDCMTADVLTKWALQSTDLCPQLRSVLRAHQARMWRSS